jgi:hypothetical protein
MNFSRAAIDSSIRRSFSRAYSASVSALQSA